MATSSMSGTYQMLMNAKTIVIITPGFPADEADSTCLPPQQIFMKALKEDRPKLNIIVLSLEYPFITTEYEWHHIKVISFGGGRKGKLSGLVKYIRIWRTLRTLKKEYPGMQLLSFWFGKASFIAASFAKRYQLRHYSWILGQDARAGNKYFRKIKPSADSLIALSDFIAEEVDRNYQIKPKHLIPVGINPSLFQPGISNRYIDIMAAGNLIPLKQYHILLEIVNELKKDFPRIKAVICGDGPEMKRLSSRLQELDLQKNVSLIGRKPHNEVLILMQQSRLFLHTSNYEGFGAVCLEALYAGARVISFVQPMKDLIENWHIAGNTTHMTEIAAYLLKNESSCNQAVLPFNIRDNVRKMMQLFDASSLQSPQKRDET